LKTINLELRIPIKNASREDFEMMNENGYMYGWMMTGNWGVTHFLFFAVMAAVVLYPVGLILRKLGYSPFWAVLACVPGVNLIGLWIVALGLNNADVEQLRAADRAGGT
jgi:hypothetical protein